MHYFLRPLLLQSQRNLFHPEENFARHGLQAFPISTGRQVRREHGFEQCGHQPYFKETSRAAAACSNLRVLNPGLPQVREYVVRVIMDIVRRYDVDGIHFDDYFYESGTGSQDSVTYVLNGRGISTIEDWRRDNVNLFVRMCYDSIRSAKPWVKFGVSPRGIWKNDISEGGAGTAGIYFYRMEAVSTSNLEKRFVQRSEFLTMACVQGKKKMGDDVTPGMMNSVMHYRAKELKSRSAFDLKEAGKSQKDVWSHERVYVDRVVAVDGCTTSLAEFLLPTRVTLLDFA